MQNLLLTIKCVEVFYLYFQYCRFT